MSQNTDSYRIKNSGNFKSKIEISKFGSQTIERNNQKHKLKTENSSTNFHRIKVLISFEILKL